MPIRGCALDLRLGSGQVGSGFERHDVAAAHVSTHGPVECHPCPLVRQPEDMDLFPVPSGSRFFGWRAQLRGRSELFPVSLGQTHFSQTEQRANSGPAHLFFRDRQFFWDRAPPAPVREFELAEALGIRFLRLAVLGDHRIHIRLEPSRAADGDHGIDLPIPADRESLDASAVAGKHPAVGFLNASVPAPNVTDDDLDFAVFTSVWIGHALPVKQVHRRDQGRWKRGRWRRPSLVLQRWLRQSRSVELRRRLRFCRKRPLAATRIAQMNSHDREFRNAIRRYSPWQAASNRMMLVQPSILPHTHGMHHRRRMKATPCGS